MEKIIAAGKITKDVKKVLQSQAKKKKITLSKLIEQILTAHVLTNAIETKNPLI